MVLVGPGNQETKNRWKTIFETAFNSSGSYSLCFLWMRKSAGFPCFHNRPVQFAIPGPADSEPCRGSSAGQ